MWSSEAVSYGILYTDRDEYIFFGQTIKDNQIALKTCLMIAASQSAHVSSIINYTFNCLK